MTDQLKILWVRETWTNMILVQGYNYFCICQSHLPNEPHRGMNGELMGKGSLHRNKDDFFFFPTFVTFFNWNICYCCLVAKSCPTICDPMDCSPPGSSVYGISQARILEWVAISFSRGYSQPRDLTCISCASCVGRWFLYHWATREALFSYSVQFGSVAQSCPTLCDPMNHSSPGLPVHH